VHLDPVVEHWIRLAAEHLDGVAEVDERLGQMTVCRHPGRLHCGLPR
jgi:hypothetical protein